MNKLITYAILGTLILTLTGCDIESVQLSNPTCKVFPVKGSSYKYVLYDHNASVVKAVSVNDSGTISYTYGSITLDEYENKTLPMVEVKINRKMIKTPIAWKLGDTYTIYLENNRLMCESSNNRISQILHFAELNGDSIIINKPDLNGNVQSLTVTNYVTITNYVESMEVGYDKIDFNFHKQND